MSLFGKPKTSLGIDLGAGGMKLVELSLEKNRPVLHTYALSAEKQNVHKLEMAPEKGVKELVARGVVEQKPQASRVATDDAQVKKYADTVKAVYKAARAVSKSAVVGLPVSAVFHAVVTLPVVKKEDLDRMVKAEVKKLVAMPIEEIAVDYRVLNGTKDEKIQRVLINAVSQDLINFYSKVFQTAGLQIDALEPESAALTRCLVGLDKSVTLLADIGQERTNFFIVDNGIPATHQSIETGGEKADRVIQRILDADPDKTEQVKRDLFGGLLSRNLETGLSKEKFMDIFVSVVDPIMKEIEISLELYLRQSGNEGKRLEKIILTGGMGFMPYLTDYISNKFNVKCFLGDPWARVVYQDGLRPVLREIGPRMSVAIGLALRNMI